MDNSKRQLLLYRGVQVVENSKSKNRTVEHAKKIRSVVMSVVYVFI